MILLSASASGVLGLQACFTVLRVNFPQLLLLQSLTPIAGFLGLNLLNPLEALPTGIPLNCGTKPILKIKQRSEVIVCSPV